MQDRYLSQNYERNFGKGAEDPAVQNHKKSIPEMQTCHFEGTLLNITNPLKVALKVAHKHNIRKRA
jgi:hypothetical protein